MKSTPLKPFHWICSIINRFVTDILKMCMKKFNGNLIDELTRLGTAFFPKESYLILE